ncbi:MAG: DUF262 domain-containing protein [Brevinemataceae bacterium]
MQAHEASFKSITDEYQKLIIPFYQRSYVWFNSDWEKFYEDLYSSMKNKKEHFLGSLLIKKDSNHKHGYVVDGQQRLTTFSLLLRSLYIDKLKDRWATKGTLPTLWDFPEDDALPKLEHSYLDNKEFSDIIDYHRKTEPTKTNSKMIQCYTYFEQNITELSYEEQKDFFDYLVSKNLFVHITIEDSEDEQKIFDSINTTGQPLAVTDIIKNALFHRLLTFDCMSKDSISKYYKDFWESIFEHTETQRDFWNAKQDIGRYKRYRSEILLHGIAICEGILKETDSFNKISTRFKEEFNKLSKDEIIELLKKIHTYATDFISWELFNNKTEFHYLDNSETRLFHYLTVSPTTTIYPILMLLRSRIYHQKELYYKCIQLIESYLIRRSLLEYTDKQYNKTFTKLVSKIRDLSDDQIFNTILKELNTFTANTDIFPDDKLLSQLHTIHPSHTITKFVLFWTALYLDNPKSENTKLIYDKKLTIEHLMPQKWEEYWNIENFTPEQKENRNSLIYTLGNLSLLSNKLNSTLQNQNWETKVHGNDTIDKGIAKLSILNLNKDYSENGLLNHNEWNEEEITKRTNRLIDIIKTIWAY